jgi:hypothetical protein
MADEKSPIPLSEAIRALRSEIVEAAGEGKDKDVRFRMGDIELEFGLEVGRQKGVNGGIQFWVISLGARGESTKATTHTVRLKLTPVGLDGDVLVSDKESGRPD